MPNWHWLSLLHRRPNLLRHRHHCANRLRLSRRYLQRHSHPHYRYFHCHHYHPIALPPLR